jgi:endonuclease/exonuclease/phosphatase (EEP) superfamily protein YafD
MLRFANFSLGFLVLALGCASLGDRQWFLDLFSHFMLQYWVVALLLLLFFLAKKNAMKSKWKVYLSLACLIYTSVLLAVVVGHRAPMVKVPKEEERVRIFEFNTAGNGDILKNWLPIHQKDYDLVVLLEVHAGFQELLEKLKSEYPYQMVHPESSPFGMAVLSRWEIVDTKEFETEGGLYPQYVLQVKRPTGDEFLLFTLHAPPPFAPQLAEAHDAIFGELAEKLHQRKLPAVVVGDLNTTASSRPYSKLIKDTNLRDTAGISPWANTWPAGFVNFASLLGIRIDHCLVTNSFSIVERERLMDLGSDHLPIKCVIQLEK